jgi:glycogen operon protein
VTCHDGFTLHDLVSYNEKHNEANGEQNRDGLNDNYSWNCGHEGPTRDPKVNALRLRQAKNLMATLMLSQGVPMVLAGDEFLRTQSGNNNAWCQDNETSWVDWGLAEENEEFLRFTREMIWLRRRHPALRRRRFFVGELRPAGDWRVGVTPRTPPPASPFPRTGPVRPSEAGLPPDARVHSADATGRPTDEPGPAPVPLTAPALADIHWHGVEPYQPDFGHYARTLAFALDGRFTGREQDHDYQLDTDFYVAMNAYHEPLKFRVPPSPTRRRWRRVVDTAQPGPRDFIPEGEGPVIAEGSLHPVAAYSMVVLVSEH